MGGKNPQVKGKASEGLSRPKALLPVNVNFAINDMFSFGKKRNGVLITNSPRQINWLLWLFLKEPVKYLCLLAKPATECHYPCLSNIPDIEYAIRPLGARGFVCPKQPLWSKVRVNIELAFVPQSNFFKGNRCPYYPPKLPPCLFWWAVSFIHRNLDSRCVLRLSLQPAQNGSVVPLKWQVMHLENESGSPFGVSKKPPKAPPPCTAAMKAHHAQANVILEPYHQQLGISQGGGCSEAWRPGWSIWHCWNILPMCSFTESEKDISSRWRSFLTSHP